MLNGQCGEVRVGNQIGGGVAPFEHSLKDVPVILGRLDQADTRLLEPGLNSATGLRQRQRALLQSGIGANPNKCLDNGPAKAHMASAAQLSIPPIPRESM